MICGGQISLTVLDTTSLVKRGAEIHSVSGAEGEIFGGLLTCGAYFSSALKEERCGVSLTVKAKEGDGAVSVSADGAMHVRGYIDGSCSHTLVGGTLTVVREDGFSRPFVGACEIEKDDISDLMEKYFQQSEQIPTAVAIRSVFSGERCVFAGGVVMQLLPDADDGAVEAAGKAFNAYAAAEDTEMNADEIFSRWFSSLGHGEITEFKPVYRCNCSEEKIKGVLAALGKEELIKMVRETGEIRVHCHYCNKDYVYDEKRIEETF